MEIKRRNFISGVITSLPYIDAKRNNIDQFIGTIGPMKIGSSNYTTPCLQLNSILKNNSHSYDMIHDTIWSDEIFDTNTKMYYQDDYLRSFVIYITTNGVNIADYI